MKIVRAFVILVILFTGFGSLSQNCFNQIANQEVIFNVEDEESMKKVISNIDCFLGMGMDETDVKIFKSNRDLIFAVILDIASRQEQATYRALHSELTEIVQDEEYQASKPKWLKVIDFFQLPADYKNWEKDKLLLIDAGMTLDELNQFSFYLEKNSDPSKTYEQLFREYSNYAVSNDFDTTDYQLFAKLNTIDLDKTMLTSEEEMIPVIFYFTGYSVANARKMEQMITDELNIFMMLAEEFIFIPMYCDDNTPLDLAKQFYSEELQKNVTTEGELAQHYQLSLFQRSDQPYFVGVNQNMEKLAELTFNMNTGAIVDFINTFNDAYFGSMELPDFLIDEE
jgi:hypothetical protein